MSDDDAAADAHDRAPGESGDEAIAGVGGSLIGLALAAGLTALSFWVASDRGVFWQPGVSAGLIALAVAQMGIHLVFFLHLTTGQDNVNNALAVAFGVLIIVLVGAGSLWIMANLDANMMPGPDMTNMQMQH